MGISSRQDRRNDEITAPQLRVINDKGEQLGIMDRDAALEMATQASLDLVEVSPNAEPPVAKIMDYGKYQFQKSKQQQVARKKQKQIQVKEIKFRPGTDIGDYKTKLNKLIQFLEDGDKVKVTLRFRGREMAHQELGLELLQRVKTDLDELGVVEQEPKSEGRLMVMVMAPRKTVA